ncbi:dipicolinic acid synthetase subunit A [Alkalibacillus almallahensis]|uniref:dipicolinic acid synthetase subunit A n=1 Tax=Alkalibacillus almallahensis TaxID=1379154 RepID=UPI00141DF535|nr:dipicolinic acid synthetase subunit A [Alkalibacillus almallahensis]NIK10840.1 dipicolinate synthase subunit A [Alkalibacillus almallahensis]
MLTGKTALIVGGDARYIELMKQLLLYDASVYAIGFDDAEDELTGVISITEQQVDHTTIDFVVLPISGVDEEGFVDTHFRRPSIQLSDEWFTSFSDDCTVFTGIMTPYLNQLSESSIAITALMNRDDLAIYNSIPTAEGAIMLGIQHTDVTLHDANVVVLGYGRVGKTIAKSFQGLGSRVSVYARSDADLARIYETHATPITYDQLLNAASTAHLMINTIPKLVVTPEVIQKLPTSCFILDLASKPGGVDFRFAKKRGIETMLAPSLPGLVAPKTAGKMLAHVIQMIIQDHE